MTAAQAKAYKPSHKPFQLAESRLGVAKNEWLHAAQSVYHDIVPAKAVGIASAWVNRRPMFPPAEETRQPSIKPDVEVGSLGQLARIANC